jgi:hypothetical protein
MRLFGEGHPALRATYIYKKNGRRHELLTSTEYQMVDEEPFVVGVGGKDALEQFIESHARRFSQDYLQLAYEHFEESYSAGSLRLKFLALMIALEVLFNDGPQELRYRVSRAAALVLGRDRDEARTVFKEVQILYDKRSKLVHTGKSGLIHVDDVIRLRCLVRDSIRKIERWKCPKDVLSRSLTEGGFGAFEPVSVQPENGEQS